MNAKAKAVLSSLGGVGALVLYLTFIAAMLGIFFLALRFLAGIANLLAAISLIFVVPLLLIALIFKRARHFCGKGAVWISYLLGVSTWLTATVWLYDLWGTSAVVIGVLIFGIGSVPLGCVALLFHHEFGVFWELIGQLVALYVLRIVGFWIESKGDKGPEPVSSISPEESAKYWLDLGRDCYDRAERDKWNPARAVEFFENGLQVMPSNADLHFWLGTMYYDGEGVAQDYMQAFEHFNFAAQLGHVDAQRSLGEMYEEGHGVDANLGGAIGWYTRAAIAGDAYSKERLDFWRSLEENEEADDEVES